MGESRLRAQHRCAPTDSRPFAIRHSSFVLRNQGGRKARPYTGKFPLPLREGQGEGKTIRHSQFAIRRSFPLAARRWLLAVFRHSPFAIRGFFPFAIRYSPSFSARRVSPFAASVHSARSIAYPSSIGARGVIGPPYRCGPQP
jgi:hypothetical protein